MNANWTTPGSRWWRMDLHAHTPASPDWASDSQASDPWLQWLEAARDAKLDAVAVTDHNTVDGIARLQGLRAEVANAPVIFPGVELTTENGTHVLLLADPESSDTDVADFLSRVNVLPADRGTKEARSRWSLTKILDELGADAVIVPAHVNKPRGLLKTYDSGSFADILRHDALAAVEVDPEGASPDRHMRWFDGSVPEIGRRIPQIWSSDSHSCGDVGRRFTWVKMTRPTLDGLRLALLDGDDSIRPGQATDDIASSPNSRVAASFLQHVSVRDAKYMGRGEPFKVHFSPWLTTIIGGRGTGKSTLVDFLRKTLRRDQELDAGASDGESEIRRAFDSRMSISDSRADDGLLLEESRACAVYCKDGQRFELGWSQDGSAATISRIEGDNRIAERGDIRERFPVRVYSQKQLFALAQKPRALLSVLDAAPSVRGAAFERRLKELESRYLSLRAERRSAETMADALEIKQASLGDVRHKLERLETADYAKVLTRHRRLRSLDDTWTQLAEQAVAAIKKTAQEAGDLDVADLALDADRGNSAVKRLETIYTSLKSIMERARRNVEDALMTAEEEVQALLVGETCREWKLAVRETGTAVKDAVAELASSGVSVGEEYSDLVATAAGLENEIKCLKIERERARGLARDAKDVLAEYRDVRREWTDRRVEFAKELSGDDIDIVIDPLADMDDLKGEIGHRLGISSHYENDRTTLTERIKSPGVEGWAKELDGVTTELEALRRGEDIDTKIRDHRFKKTMRDKSAEAIDHVALYLPGDDVAIHFRERARGKWKPIGQGSPGQQTAALLSLVLSYGSEPIVLDQPEDDLDNTLVYDLVVSRLKEVKNKRQVIVITHNPNIVVHGDAEYVLSFESVNGRTMVTREGGLQETGVREEICRVMEGGPQAFERRFKKIVGKMSEGSL